MTSFALAFAQFKKLAHCASMYWDAFVGGKALFWSQSTYSERAGAGLDASTFIACFVTGFASAVSLAFFLSCYASFFDRCRLLFV